MIFDKPKRLIVLANGQQVTIRQAVIRANKLKRAAKESAQKP